MDRDNSETLAETAGPRERAIFLAALDIDADDARRAHLDAACGDDAAMRQRVEVLLRSHREAGGDFLEAPPLAGFPPGVYAAPVVEGPGTRIGRYRLLKKIGEGGMGVVYMAEQEHPVRRRVALKIIKPGMDSAQVIARFEAERQALAIMDHFNIARVLEAGQTAAGRPYFVMELVNGVPVTTYCDEGNLTLEERLALFVPVCRAVQHAHQKGVIHRDIKPSNVLVTMHDGQPVPKVIDFGVAKALDRRLTERTLFTNFGVMVGTFEYMAPEQAEISAFGVDTRSDVYSLGVLLYELLTGTTPLERRRLHEAAFDEVVRLIREEEPPRPSTRLSMSGETLGSISARRRVEPQKLTRLVRGELDWVVMKCLEKDRARRYQTADALANDVTRHLNDEPVSAGPPGARYRLWKFARRNRAALATAGAVAAALVVGLGVATAGLVRARSERDRAVQAVAKEAEQRAAARRSETAALRAAAKSEEVNRLLCEMLSNVDGRGGGGGGGGGTAGGAAGEPTIRQVLERAARKLDEGLLAAQPDVEAKLRHTIGSAYLSLGQPAAAGPQLAAALALQRPELGDEHPDVAATLFTMGELAVARRDYGEGVRNYREALAIRRKAFGEEHRLVAQTLTRLADALGRAGSLTEASELHERAVALSRKLAGERSLDAAASLSNRGVTLALKGDWPAAESQLRQALGLYRELLGDDHRVLANIVCNLGIARRAQGDTAGAEPLLRDAVARHRKLGGRDRGTASLALHNLHEILAARHDPEAKAVQMEILSVEVERLTHEMEALPNDPQFPWDRGSALARLGRFEESLADRERAARLDPTHYNAKFAMLISRLYLGDVDGYRAAARDMFDRFGKAESVDVGDLVVKAYMLNPPPGADLAPFVALADRFGAANLPADRVGWFELTRAMAEHRAGRHASALEWLERFRSHVRGISFGDNRNPEVTGLALAAMAHHALGQASEARARLKEARHLAGQLPKPGQEDLGPGPDNWIVGQIFLREADGMIEPAATASQAR